FLSESLAAVSFGHRGNPLEPNLSGILSPPLRGWAERSGPSAATVRGAQPSPAALAHLRSPWRGPCCPCSSAAGLGISTGHLDQPLIRRGRLPPTGRRCGRFPAIHLRRRVVSQRLVRPFVTIKPQVGPQGRLTLRARGILLQVNLLVLHRPPQTLD